MSSIFSAPCNIHVHVLSIVIGFTQFQSKGPRSLPGRKREGGAYPKVVSVNKHDRERGGFSHTLAPLLQVFAVVNVQGDVLLKELHAVVLEDLPDQLASLEGCPHHAEACGVDDDPPELKQ